MFWLRLRENYSFLTFLLRVLIATVQRVTMANVVRSEWTHVILPRVWTAGDAPRCMRTIPSIVSVLAVTRDRFVRRTLMIVWSIWRNAWTEPCVKIEWMASCVDARRDIQVFIVNLVSQQRQVPVFMALLSAKFCACDYHLAYRAIIVSKECLVILESQSKWRPDTMWNSRQRLACTSCQKIAC